MNAVQPQRHEFTDPGPLSSGLQNLLASTEIPTIFLDRELRVLHFTPKLDELFEIAHSDVGRPLSELPHRLGYHPLLADAETVLRNLTAVEREVVDDAGRWYSARVLPYRRVSEGVEGVVLVFVDITRLKEAEASLRLSEGKYRSLFEKMDEGFFIIEKVSAEGEPPDFRWIEANPAFRRHAGRSLTGKSMRATFHETSEAAEIYDAVLRTGEPVRFEYTMPSLGTVLDLHAFRMGGPDTRKVAVLFQDITQRKRAEQRQAFLLKLSDALRRLSDPAAIQNAAMRVLGEHLGVARAQYFEAELGGQYVASSGGYTNGTRPLLTRLRLDDVGSHIGKAHRAGHTLAVGELYADDRISAIERRAYEALGVRAFVGVPLVKDGRLVAAVGVDQEYPRVWSEDDLAIIEEAAERSWLASERARTEEQLKDADKRKDEYLAMLGHELRNPLAAIRNATEILRRVNPEDERLRGATSVLYRQSVHMSRIIEGLLDVSRVARGKIALDVRPLDVRRVLEGVLELRRAQCDARGLELETELATEPLCVMADEARLVQVFDNLVGNAIKFTQPHGRITVSARRNERDVVVCVRDTGSGIRSEILTSIFEPFHQDTQDVARASGGLGLGLSLAKGLVELHEGAIEARSEGPGKGSEFEVRLPLTSVREEARRSEPRHHLAPLQVLIVEDNDDAAAVLRELLELSGHEVVVAETGPAALELLRQRSVDVALCDVGLPGMSGLELAREIRKDPTQRALPLIALTGYGQPEDRKRSAEAGFNEHLTKPVDFGTLNDVLQQACRAN